MPNMSANFHGVAAIKAQASKAVPGCFSIELTSGDGSAALLTIFLDQTDDAGALAAHFTSMINGATGRDTNSNPAVDDLPGRASPET